MDDLKVQAIFDTVIGAGIYPQISDYMCNALDYAASTGLITLKDASRARRAIRQYSGSGLRGYYGTLKCALEAHGLPGMRAHRLAVYKDWANRPALIANSEVHNYAQRF